VVAVYRLPDAVQCVAASVSVSLSVALSLCLCGLLPAWDNEPVFTANFIVSRRDVTAATTDRGPAQALLA